MSTNLWTPEQWRERERLYLQRGAMRFHFSMKRTMDLLLAGIGCLIMSPVLIAIALAVRLSSPGPVFFKQERLGRLGEKFNMFKFRTMIVGAINQGAGLATFSGDPRVTRIGKYLREYHLDELPQLFNVLLGNMCLVGPRPVLMSALPTYNDWEKKRLLVPPGITGWQQVNGGAINDVDERIRLDVWYVDHCTLWLDLKILVRTFSVVVRKEGVYGADGWQRGRSIDGPTSNRVTEFKGNHPIN